MNFFRRNISGGGGGGHSNNGGGGSADNLISTAGKHHDIYIQNKFGSTSFAPNMIATDFTSASFDQKDNLAR